MNITGLVLAFVGALFLGLAQWQMSPLVALWSVNFIRVSGSDAKLERMAKLSKRNTFIGWTLVIVGFLLQLLAAIFYKPPEISLVLMYLI